MATSRCLRTDTCCACSWRTGSGCQQAAANIFCWIQAPWVSSATTARYLLCGFGIGLSSTERGDWADQKFGGSRDERIKGSTCRWPDLSDGYDLSVSRSIKRYPVVKESDRCRSPRSPAI